MQGKIYNLDENLQEYCEFILKGNNYRFKLLTVEEIDQFDKLEGDELKSREFLFNKIEKVNPKAPEFSELYNQMTSPQVFKFMKMVKSEMSDNADN